MGLDLYAACKTIGRIKTKPTKTASQLFRHIPNDYFDSRYVKVGYFCPRNLISQLEQDEHFELAQRFYGDLAGAKHHFPDESIYEMPADLIDSDLPWVITPEVALSLADDLAGMHYEDVPKAVAYLRLWGRNGHPISCSM